MVGSSNPSVPYVSIDYIMSARPGSTSGWIHTESRFQLQSNLF